MKLATSMELVWQLAAREAMAGEFKEIEPEHVLAAVLKFAEMPLQGMVNLGVGTDVATALAGDVKAVQEDLQTRGVDSTRTRRELRALLGKGGCPYSGGAIHRSPVCRDCFAAAAKLADEARSDTLTVRHLLKALMASPTARMAKVFGGGVVPQSPTPRKTPNLDAVGQDLAKADAPGASPEGGERPAEVKALLQALGREGRKSVLLITDREETVKSVVAGVAKAIADKNVPANLQGRRIVDITAMTGLMSGDSEAQQRVMRLFSEASSAKEVVLYLPAIDLAEDARGLKDYGSFLKAQLKGGSVQCLCRVAPASYTLLAGGDRAWKQMVDVLYLHDRRDVGLPQEL